MIVVVKVPGIADLTLLLCQRSKALNMAATSSPAIIQDLPDALLGNAKHLSQCRYRLTFFVTCADFSIACAFADGAIGDGSLRQKLVVI